MDNDKPASVSIMKDFVGLYSDADPSDIPNGAMSEQINIFSLQRGTMETRGGLHEVSLTRLE